MAYWNRRTKAERPEWPKLVPIRGTMEEARAWESELKTEDPEAELVEGGTHGVFARCHNPASLSVAQRLGNPPKR